MLVALLQRLNAQHAGLLDELRTGTEAGAAAIRTASLTQRMVQDVLAANILPPGASSVGSQHAVEQGSTLNRIARLTERYRVRVRLVYGVSFGVLPPRPLADV